MAKAKTTAATPAEKTRPTFTFPPGAEKHDAAVFAADGSLIEVGDFDDCKNAANVHRGYFCIWMDGVPMVKQDFTG